MNLNSRSVGSVAVLCVLLGMVAFGRAAWRAHRDLVSLDVQNEPVREVIGSLERQTWDTIYCDANLTSRITLKVYDQPLCSVLNLVADQAGARWQRVFAVGETRGTAEAQLKASFENALPLTSTVWADLSPRFSKTDLKRIFRGHVGSFASQGFSGNFPPGASGGFGMSGRGGHTHTFTFSPDGTTRQWSSERLVIEKRFLPKLGAKTGIEPSTAVAKKIAAEVGSQSHLCYALEQTPFQRAGIGTMRTAEYKKWRDLAASGTIDSFIGERQREHRLRLLSGSPEEQVEAAQRGGQGMRSQNYPAGN